MSNDLIPNELGTEIEKLAKSKTDEAIQKHSEDIKKEISSNNEKLKAEVAGEIQKEFKNLEESMTEKFDSLNKSKQKDEAPCQIALANAVFGKLFNKEMTDELRGHFEKSGVKTMAGDNGLLLPDAYKDTMLAEIADKSSVINYVNKINIGDTDSYKLPKTKYVGTHKANSTERGNYANFTYNQSLIQASLAPYNSSTTITAMFLDFAVKDLWDLSMTYLRDGQERTQAADIFGVNLTIDQYDMVSATANLENGNENALEGIIPTINAISNFTQETGASQVFTLDDFLKLKESFDDQISGNLVAFINKKKFGEMEREKGTSNDHYILSEGTALNGAPRTIRGVTVIPTTYIPEDYPCLMGDFKKGYNYIYPSNKDRLELDQFAGPNRQPSVKSLYYTTYAGGKIAMEKAFRLLKLKA